MSQDSDTNPDTRVAIVSFAFDDSDEAFITLESDWVASIGQVPNVNVATVPAAEFSKIQRSSYKSGTVRFYFEDEDAADVELDGIAIVDVQGGRIGQLRGADGKPGSTQWIDYKVFFADARRDLLPPRGGVLMDGDVNPEPLPQGMKASDLLDNNKLVSKCLSAAGVDFEVDGDFTAAQPMRKLQWFGARAPDELSKLMQWCGGCLGVTSDGVIVANILGQGDGAPSIDPEDLLANLPVPTFDRRGKTVVYVSAPTAAQEIHDENDSGDNVPSWDFVARDSKGKWTRLDDNDLLEDNGSIDDMVKNGFADLPEANRAQLAADVYYCLQLDSDSYDPRYASLLKQIATDDGYLSNITAKATVACRSAADGSWSNSTDDIQLTPTHVYGYDNVIRFAERLGTVKTSPTLDPNSGFKSLDESDVTISFAVESAGKDGTGKSYFACGFVGDNGKAYPISDDEVTSALLGGGDDVVILHAPASRLLKEDGDDQGKNFNDLKNACQNMAGVFLQNNTIDHRVIVARGFYYADLSGVVSEVRYSQASATTTITVNGWIHPSGAAQVPTSVASSLVTTAARSGSVAAGGSPGGEAFSQQVVTQGDRAAIGGSAAVMPVYQVGTVPTPAALRFDVVVEVTGNETGQGIYDGHFVDPPLAPDPSAGVVIDFTDSSGATQKALICNIGETSGGGSTGHIIPSDGPKLFGMRGPSITDKSSPAYGKTVVWVNYDPDCFRNFQFITDPKNSSQQLFQGHRSGTKKSPPSSTDANWETLLTFTGCNQSS